MLEAAQADRFERRHDSAVHLRAFHTDLFHRERDFMRDVGREQLRFEILEDHANLWRNVADAKMVERLAGDGDRAMKLAVLEFGHDAIEAFRERGFSRARRTHHANHLAGVLHKAHRSKRGPILAVVGEGDALDPHRVRAGSY